MDGKCQSMIRTRWDSQGNIINLRNPEPCGVPAVVYEVRAAAKKNRERKPIQSPKFELNVALPESIASIRQAFCDKHRKKAEREGMVLTKVEDVCSPVT